MLFIQTFAAALLATLFFAYIVGKPRAAKTWAQVIAGAEAFAGIAPSLAKLTSSYRNNRTIWLLPTRGAIPLEVHVSLRNMALPMNTPRACMEQRGKEVGEAYEQGVEKILGDEITKDFPWIWTYEEDNIQPGDVFFKLFDAIWKCIDCGEKMPADEKGSPATPWVCPNGHKGLDAIGGLYYTKTEPPMAMAFGDAKSEKLEFRPLDVEEARKEGKVVEVNGLAMGCTLFRKQMFREIPQPWFRTLSGAEGQGAYTQDLYFAQKAKEEIGARFAVHTGVMVGHLDVATGKVY